MTVATAAPTVVRTIGHHYFAGDRELLGVTRVLNAAKITDYSAPWFTEWHRQRGQLVHQTVALENEGVLDDATLDPQLMGYLAGYRQFRSEVGGDVEFYEQIVSDVTLGVAGTLDLIVRHPSDHELRRRLYDIKPCDAPATAIQLAAYAKFARALYARPISFQRAALVLPGDGTYEVVPYTDAHDELVFLAALRVAHWRIAHGGC